MHCIPFQYRTLNGARSAEIGKLRARWPIVLDLEDSVQVLHDTPATLGLKSDSRQVLLDNVDKLAAKSRKGSIALRINEPGTSHFRNDMSALADIGGRVTWSHIVTPKVSSKEALDELRLQLEAGEVAVGSVVALLETEEGIENVDSITRFSHKAGVSHVAFGHFDYNLSLGYWPFIDHECEEYWAVARRIAESAESNGLTYMHTPVCWKQVDEFASCLSRLAVICRRPFACQILYPRHAAYCVTRQLLSLTHPFKRTLRSNGGSDAIKRAIEVKRQYEQRTDKKKPFVIGKRFISPHEYLRACEVLDENGRGNE